MDTKGLNVLFIVVLLPVLTFAQINLNDPKYGKDSITRVECLKNLSLYGEYLKQDRLYEAKSSWQKVFTFCPSASLNTYINGIKIFKTLIEAEKNPVIKKHYLDTLMLIHDRRIQHFNRKGYVLGRKACDYVKYSPDSLTAAFKMLNESVELEKEQSEAIVITTRYQVATLLYNKKLISGEELINNYHQNSSYLKTQLTLNPNNEDIKSALARVEQLFTSSGVATCENLVAIFAPKFRDNPNDIEQNKKIVAMLNYSNCNDKLLREITEAIYAADSSVEAAFNLGKMLEMEGDFTKAAGYYNEAIKKQGDKKLKSTYYCALGNLYNREPNNKPAARTAAYKAIESDESNGLAYLLLGNIYVGVRNCGETDFAKQSIYWLVVDKYNKAKQVDPNLTNEANRLIAIYSPHFPSKEEIFFQGLSNGQTVTVGCWINETTCVR